MLCVLSSSAFLTLVYILHHVMTVNIDATIATACTLDGVMHFHHFVVVKFDLTIYAPKYILDHSFQPSGCLVDFSVLETQFMLGGFSCAGSHGNCIPHKLKTNPCLC